MAASLEQQIKCVEREIKTRIHVYAGLVQRGTMTKSKAGFEIATMREVLATLRRLHETNHPTLDLGGSDGVRG